MLKVFILYINLNIANSISQSILPEANCQSPISSGIRMFAPT